MSKTVTVENFYKPDEMLGALYILMRDRDVLTFIKQYPWSHSSTIAEALKSDEKNVDNILTDLKNYGFLKSDVREVILSTPTSMGRGRAHYALSDDIDERVSEITNASVSSELVYTMRKSEFEKDIKPIFTKKQQKELIENLTKSLAPYSKRIF